jgi:hypothetical protein
MHKGLKEPHVLLASNNPQRLLANLAGILTYTELAKIHAELDRNTVALFHLGESHLAFCGHIAASEWRQRISRYYYAAYNIKRAVSLNFDGSFSTDASDHAKIDVLPDGFPNAATYATRLKNLRDDRNLADYSHLASSSDLLISADEAEKLVTQFKDDSRAFLASRGLAV